MARTPEEWDYRLTQLLVKLDKAERFIPVLEAYRAAYEQSLQAARRVHAATNTEGKKLRRRLRQQSKRIAQARKSIAQLLVSIRYGNALMATYQDGEQFKKMLARRATRVRVRKHRAKKQEANVGG